MTNISGTLFSGTQGVSASTTTTVDYSQYKPTSYTSSMLTTLYNLFKNNISSLTLVSSSVQSTSGYYICSHPFLDSGHYLCFYFSTAVGVVVGEGTFAGGEIGWLNFIKLTYYGGFCTINSNSRITNVNFSIHYKYRLIVSDDGKYFAFTVKAAQYDIPASYMEEGETLEQGSVSTLGTVRTCVCTTYENGSTTLFLLKTSDGKANIYVALPFIRDKALNGFNGSIIRVSTYGATYFGAGTQFWGTKDPSGYKENPYRNGWCIVSCRYILSFCYSPSYSMSRSTAQMNTAKLGVTERDGYELERLVPNVFCENLLACTKGSGYGDGDVLTIGGKKYVYTKSGYLFYVGEAE